MTYIVFANRTLADSVLKEIAASPFGQVWVFYDPEQPTNAVTYNEGADGRCMIAHPFSDEDRDWLEAYMATWIATGEVQVLDTIPADWQYPQEVV